MTSFNEAMELIRPLQVEAPVDPIEIARFFGLFVFADFLPSGVSGKIVRRPEYGSASGYAIIVNSGEAQVRQRFTVAHEIAHFILHRDQIGDGFEESAMYRVASMSNRQEAEANRLAAEILMPQHLILMAAQDGRKTAAELARMFNVSEVAMSIRLGLPT
jgi:predicted transcriptional regulator